MTNISTKSISKRYQRSEKALVAALAKMYIQGVSTRKVTAITEELRRVESVVSDDHPGLKRAIAKVITTCPQSRRWQIKF